MADEWIQIRKNLREDPAVIAIAASLGADEDLVVGKLVRFWAWSDDQTVDGYAARVTESWIDRHVCATGFAQAMVKAGWLEINTDGVKIPNFDRYMGKSAKTRALAARRMSRKRRRDADGATSAQQKRNKSVTRKEKKRKEKSITQNGKNIPPNIEDVRAYCRERNNQIDPEKFFNHYESKGWMIGKNRMKNWHAAIATWERTDAERGGRQEQRTDKATLSDFDMAHGTYTGDPEKPFIYNSRLCADLSCEVCAAKRGGQ